MKTSNNETNQTKTSNNETNQTKTIKTTHELVSPYYIFYKNVMPVLRKFMTTDSIKELYNNLWVKYVVDYQPKSSTGHLIIGKRKTDSDGSYFFYERTCRSPSVRVAEWKDRLEQFSMECTDILFGEEFSHGLFGSIRTKRSSAYRKGHNEIEWFIMKKLSWDDVSMVVKQVCIFAKKIKQLRPCLRVNINSASEIELQTLPQIGPVRSSNIVLARNHYGPFKNLDDVSQRVHRIGDGICNIIKDLIHFGPYEESQDHNQEMAAEICNGKININTASVRTLMGLPGIGTVLANRIANNRTIRPFQSTGEILGIERIGPRTYEKVKDLIMV